MFIDTETTDKTSKTDTPKESDQKTTVEEDKTPEETEPAEIDISVLRDIKPNHKQTMKLLERIENNQRAIYQELKEVRQFNTQPKYKLVDKKPINVTKEKTLNERMEELLLSPRKS